MTHPMRFVWLVATILLGVGASYSPQFSDSDMATVMPAGTHGRSVECPTGATIEVHELTAGIPAKVCDLNGLVVTFEKGGAIIPPRGSSVEASILEEDGGVTLIVEHSVDGIVTARIDEPADTHGSERQGITSYDPCDDDSGGWGLLWWLYNENDEFWLNWFDNVPTAVGPSNFRKVVDLAAVHLKDLYNDCGYDGVTSVPDGRTGYTYRHTNMIEASTCGADDGVSVVDFAPLDGPTLATNCRWYKDGYIIHSDTRFDGTSRSWVTSVRGCSGNRYDLHSVAIHEYGHYVGLRHVGDSGPNDLTMSTEIYPCNATARTLGRGDWETLELAY